jgi:hypothetical protein
MGAGHFDVLIKNERGWASRIEYHKVQVLSEDYYDRNHRLVFEEVLQKNLTPREKEFLNEDLGLDLVMSNEEPTKELKVKKMKLLIDCLKELINDIEEGTIGSS